MLTFSLAAPTLFVAGSASVWAADGGTDVRHSSSEVEAEGGDDVGDHDDEEPEDDVLHGGGNDDREDNDRFRGGGRTDARDATNAVARGWAIPLERVLPTVALVARGEVLEVDLRQNGLTEWRYEFLVLTPEGVYREVIVDARRNEVLWVGAH